LDPQQNALHACHALVGKFPIIDLLGDCGDRAHGKIRISGPVDGRGDIVEGFNQERIIIVIGDPSDLDGSFLQRIDP